MREGRKSELTSSGEGSSSSSSSSLSGSGEGALFLDLVVVLLDSAALLVDLLAEEVSKVRRKEGRVRVSSRRAR